jgi:hypothetical protein
MNNQGENQMYRQGIHTTRTSLITLWVLAVTVALSLLLPPQALAVPAFARQYQTECTTCHTIFPLRNEFGDAFEKNGYVWPGSKPMKKTAQTEEERKTSEFLSLSGLPTTVPLSAMLTQNIVYDRKSGDQWDFKSYELELLAAGSLLDKIGFFANEIVASSEAPGKTELEEAYVIWRHALDTPLNIKRGKIRPQVSLWKSDNWLIEDPATLSYNAGDTFNLQDPQNGMEVNAVLGSRFFAAAGIVDRDLGVNGSNTDRNEKEYYGHLDVKIGGTDYLGHEPDIDLDKDSLWDFLAVKLGGFGYSGKTVDTAGDALHDFYRAGLELGIQYRNLSVRLGEVKGRNTYSADPPKKSTAASAELDYLFNAKFMGLVRYDQVDVDGDATTRHIIPALAYMPIQTCKVVLSVDNEKSENNTTGMLRVQITF